ncbi:MAG: glucokinase [Solirubrobacteraceae bacterium]
MLAVGIDVGATKVAAALVDVDAGAVVASARQPTDAARGGAAVLEDCRALARSVAGDASVAAVGIAVCELVGVDGGVRSAETVDWREVDLGAAFGQLAAFVRVESDVRAAAVAEARLGAGRAEPDFLYLSVGSGISHCLVVDARPRLGVRGSAINTGAPLVEQWSGGLALARLSGHASAEEALADPAAATIVQDGARRLGLTLAMLVNALDPGAVVVGGGLGLDDRYRSLAVAAMREAIYDPQARELPVLAAALGPDAAVMGAALAAAP